MTSQPSPKLDLGAMSLSELEDSRLRLQTQRDAILDEMHGIVREQERRRKLRALRALLETMPEAERAKLLDDAKKA